MKTIWKKTVGSCICLCTLLILTNCTDEQIVSPGMAGSGKRVSVSLSFALSPITAPQGQPAAESKSGVADRAFRVRTDISASRPADSVQTRSDGNTLLYNLWVFQFDAAGNKVTAEKLPDTPAPIKDMVTIRTRLTEGTGQSLYLVSLGQWCTRDLSAIGSVKELEELQINYLNNQRSVYTSKIKGAADLPYAGRVDGVEILSLEDAGEGLIRYNPGSGVTGGISMKCLVAKVSLCFAYNVPDYELVGINIKSVPEAFSIKPGNAAGITFRDLDAVAADAITETDAEGRKVISWYIARNPGGVNANILTESDRYSVNAPATATNLEVWANKRTSVNNYAIYSIYIGGNNTSDFNIEANGNYRLYTDINATPDDKDHRIKDFTLTQSTELYCTSSKGQYFDLDAHYDWRPLTVTTSRKKVLVEIQNSNGTPAGDDAWLKVSTYPNYTAALQNRELGATTEATVIVPTKVRFYLYCDEYAVPDAAKRSMRVKVTTVGLDGSDGMSQLFSMDQRSIVSMGRFGGEFDADDGQFTKLLGIESIDESAAAYASDQRPYWGNNRWGYKDAKLPVDYGIDNAHSGFKATRMLVENPGGFKVNISSIAEPVIRNGKPELYQYTHYNGYAARYCFDKNRDLNGNGEIDYRPGDPTNELKWYMPAIYQIEGYVITVSGVNNVYTSTTVAQDNYYRNSEVLQSGSSIETVQRDATSDLRCVRDLE